MSSTIQIKANNGSYFNAYLAEPKSGKGPGIVLAQEIFGINETMRNIADYYAEEGYVVLVPDLFWRQQPDLDLSPQKDFEQASELYGGFSHDSAVNDIQSTIDALKELPSFIGKVGVLGFCLGGALAFLSACRTNADVCVGYYGVGLENWLDEADNISCELTLHFAENDDFCPANIRDVIYNKLKDMNNITLHLYLGVGHAFGRKEDTDHYHKSSALLAHERSIAAFKNVIGPYQDLNELWDKHLEFEFESRNVDATMATMVAEPYVNHIPVLTGGVGFKHLRRFYLNHFVHSNPDDTSFIPISRTIGATQIVDEMIFCFTHTKEVDWMLPNIKPTGKRVEIPLVAIVNFRGDKLYHEHIYWDQASVLVQIGLLDPTNLPVAGVETAKKLLDESIPSNKLMNNWKNSEGK